MFKLTIIVPINNTRYLTEFFKNLLNQTIGFDNIQIIFVENYSKTSEIINEFSAKYENVITISSENQRNFKGNLCNIAMKHVASDYVMFLDSSNILIENACELLYSGIIQDSSIEIISGFETINEIKNTFNIENYESNILITSIKETPTIINDLSLNTKLFKKSFIEKKNIKFLENNVECDCVFVFKAILNSNKIKFLEGIIANNINTTFPQYSKEILKNFLDACYEMFYISNEKNRLSIFIKQVLFNNLSKFLKTYLLTSDLSIFNTVSLLEYSRPLFELCNRFPNDDNELKDLFEFISKGNYENILSEIYGKKIPLQKEIKISALCDSYTYNNYKFECDFTKLELDSCLKHLKKETPHIFLVTSTFIENNSKSISNKLKKILKLCAENKIISIFWENDANNNHLNFEKIFLDFDYIFTICQKNIPYFINKGYKRVNYLPYASQPKLFNPINKDIREKNTVQYIGEWDASNKNKTEIMASTFNKIITEGYDLKIYDKKQSDAGNYPKIYNDYLHKFENYDEIPNIFKETEMGLIINTNEMYNHEIFELMSSNTLVFSNYSETIYNLFKNNIYYLGYDNNNFYPENFEKIKNENLHDVLENHTYEKRFEKILEVLNFKYIPNIKHVILFYKLNDLNELEEIYNHFYSINYPYKEIKIITPKELTYLPNTILESHLTDIQLKDNYYFCFADLNLDADFVKDSLLHFSYIDKNIGIKEDIDKKFLFYKTTDVTNVIFHNINYKKVISKNRSYFNVYYFNNFKIKVSVIIPVHNMEDYLRECLDSIINQTLKDIEIICINNGSSDSSLNILKEYHDKDTRIKIISQNDRGPGGARNTGLKIAKGKYVYFIDADDIVELNGLKEMYNQAEIKNLDMLKFNLMTFDDKTRENMSLYQRVKPAFLEELGDVIFNYKTIGSDVYTLSPNMQSSLFKREIVKDMEFPEKIIFEDNIFLIEALLRSKRVYYYDRFLSNKRERENSITNSTGEYFSDVIEIRNQIVDLAKKYNHYEDYKFTIYSRKYMFIKLLFFKTDDKYKQKFYEKIKLDCINKKEEYEKEGIFEIFDKKSNVIFKAALTTTNYKEFEEIIRDA